MHLGISCDIRKGEELFIDYPIDTAVSNVSARTGEIDTIYGRGNNEGGRGQRNDGILGVDVRPVL